MNKYGDLELSIMSCLLIKPQLIEEVIVEDKHFLKHQRLWQFMKSFYKKFKNFDITLMYSICKDKWHIINYMTWLLELEPTTSNFVLYQKQLIDLYNESRCNKWIIEKIYEASNDLFMRNINPKQFKDRVDEIYENSKKILEE